MEGIQASRQLHKHRESTKYCKMQILNVNLIKFIQSAFCWTQEKKIISQATADLLNTSSNRSLKAKHLQIQTHTFLPLVESVASVLKNQGIELLIFFSQHRTSIFCLNINIIIQVKSIQHLQQQNQKNTLCCIEAFCNLSKTSRKSPLIKQNIQFLCRSSLKKCN